MKNAYKKKLIEVAIPLEAINAEAIKEKNNSFSKGHPRALHQYWARRPNVACRALLICQLLNDPSSDPETFRTEEKQEKERLRLFNLIAEAAKWENNSNDELFARIKEEIRRSSSGEGGGGGIFLRFMTRFREGARFQLKHNDWDLMRLGVT